MVSVLCCTNCSISVVVGISIVTPLDIAINRVGLFIADRSSPFHDSSRTSVLATSSYGLVANSSTILD